MANQIDQPKFAILFCTLGGLGAYEHHGTHKNLVDIISLADQLDTWIRSLGDTATYFGVRHTNKNVCTTDYFSQPSYPL